MIALSQFVTDVTNVRLIPKAIDQVYDGNVLWTKMQGKTRTWDRGYQIIQPVYLTAPTTGGSYSGFDSFVVTQETKTGQAKFDPSQLYWNVSLSGIQLAINRSGDAGAVDLIASELDQAARALSQELGTELYGDGTGNSNRDLLGLVAAVDDTTNVNRKVVAFDKLSYMLEQLVRFLVGGLSPLKI